MQKKSRSELNTTATTKKSYNTNTQPLNAKQ